MSMSKDIFNGKIKKEQINMMKFTLFFAPFVFLLIGVGSTIILLFPYDWTILPYIIFIIFACYGYLSAFLYPMISLMVIRSYPKYEKIAHILVKKEMFVKENELQFSNIRQYSSKELRNYFLQLVPRKPIQEIILQHIYSVYICGYLRKRKDELTLFQWATIVLKFWEGKKVAIFEGLKELSTSEYEEKLLTIALKDLRKYGYIFDRTIKFYNINDPRGKDKPNVPFDEIINLPIIYKKGDILRFKKNDNDYFLILSVPTIIKEMSIDNYYYHCAKIDKYNHFDCNVNLNICVVNKIDENTLSDDTKKVIKSIIDNIN